MLEYCFKEDFTEQANMASLAQADAATLVIWCPWSISLSYLDSVVLLSKWTLQSFMLGAFQQLHLRPTNLFQPCGETARLWPAAHSFSFTSPFLIYRERKFENSFITCQGNSKHSKDSAKSPRQHSIRQKLQTELPSSPLYVTYLFTRFTVPLSSARPAVLLMLCKYLKLWSVRSGGSI